MTHPIGHHHHPVNLLQQVQIVYHGRIFSATLGSLTAEGALLETRALMLPVGMEVDISITLGQSAWLIKAVITHATPHEIGILFNQAQFALYMAARNQRPLHPHSAAPLFESSAMR